MSIRLFSLLSCALLLPGCASPQQPEGFIINGPFYHSDFLGSGNHSGEWLRHGYRLECDGYLTRRKDKGFCESEVPDDWLPFAFQGKTYYLQPLQDDRTSDLRP